jgi:hypothetical protein
LRSAGGGSLQHGNAFQNIEPFACSIFIAITAFGKDKVRYKQQIPIRRRFPPLSRDLLSCKYGCDRMQASSYVPNNSSFKRRVIAFRCQKSSDSSIKPNPMHDNAQTPGLLLVNKNRAPPKGGAQKEGKRVTSSSASSP